MNYNNQDYSIPGFWKRIASVWYRHTRVYNSSFFSNSLPPFLEPLIFLAGLGIGIGAYVQDMGGMNYILFLASGLIVTSSMYAAAFFCTYGTYVRLEYDGVYDGMLSAPLSPFDLIAGEVLFAGTKGFLFSLAVLAVMWITGIISYPMSVLASLVGFLCGIMFAVLSLFITSLTYDINHFNFYYTGLLSPMFFFSGVVFPVENLPSAWRILAELVPLTHTVRMAREFCYPGGLHAVFLLDLVYCLIFTVFFWWLTWRVLKKRLID